jgi:hypothetical protein
VCVLAGTTTTACPITDMQIIAYSQLPNFNLDPAVTTLPLYTQVQYNAYATILISYQFNALAVSSLSVSMQTGPCMNPQIQTSAYFYVLELMQYFTCPVEVNSGLITDPRYTQ